MAPRFQFHASKFRNVECKHAPREQNYDQLQLTTAMAPEGANLLTASAHAFAFPHQMNGGGAVQVQSLADTGRPSNALTPPLIRAHQKRITALQFAPFDAHLLLTASADATAKLWRLPDRERLHEDLSSPVTTLTGAANAVTGVSFHPSADQIVALYAQQQLLVYDFSTEALSFDLSGLHDGSAVQSIAWNYDGSLLVSTAQDKQLRLLDPRASTTAQTAAGHTGRRHSSVVWCGQREHFLTTGSDTMQERELKLWDPRNLSKAVHRERIDSGVGALFPLYDPDVDLLYLMGKGDRSARCFELDTTRAPFVHALDHTSLANMTFAATLLPKQVCTTSECEVARVLNLSSTGGGTCEVLRYTVPRKDAAHAFQSDLYPDTRASKAAMSSSEWVAGRNAEPILEAVRPTATKAKTGLNHVFAAPVAASPWGAAPPTASPWGAAPSGVIAPPATPNWGSVAVSAPPKAAPVPAWHAPAAAPSQPPAWNAAPAAVPASAKTAAWHATSEAPSKPASWEQPVTAPPPTAATEEPPAADDKLSDKAQKLGSKYGHKLKYMKGTQTPRNHIFHFGDRSVASSLIASPIVAANSKFWAVPVVGAGGPVLIRALDATGKASLDTPVINGQKAAVTELAFNPFNDSMLATGSADSTVQIWSLDAHGSAANADHTLRGHTKTIRTLRFHPTAANVLCSSSLDLSLRFWDVETAQEQICIQGKLDDMIWNMEFSPNGNLLATTSRAKILRVFDPRAQEHVLSSMGCGHDSSKPQFVSWVDDSRLLTVGVNARNETQLSFWDSRSLIEPLSSKTIETSASSSVHYPFYDVSSRLFFLVGMGDRHVWSYEIDAENSTAHENLPFAFGGQTPICGAALLPKTLCDIKNVELDRMLLMTATSMERVSFSLPRTDALKEFFQDDIYRPARTAEPVLSANQWFAGETAEPAFQSLQPNGMVPLSEKPVETNRARPKTLDFQARIRQEDEEKRLKAEQFERLNALASQPSLHSLHGPSAVAKREMSDSDDDDWDD